MTLSEFNNSLSQIEPPSVWSVHLRSLWYDAKGDWQSAHDLIDHLQDRDSAHLHAYLHRKEGDQWNANYWYKRAKQPVCELPLEQEWKALFEKFS